MVDLSEVSHSVRAWSGMRNRLIFVAILARLILDSLLFVGVLFGVLSSIC
jgi:hypothetical protein